MIINNKHKNNCEYFCLNCGQLRLSINDRDPDQCKNCGSIKLIIGEVGCLDKDGLKAKFDNKVVTFCDV